MWRTGFAVLLAWGALALVVAQVSTPIQAKAPETLLQQNAPLGSNGQWDIPSNVPSNILILAHWLGWFGSPNHRRPVPAYGSTDRATIRRQIADAKSKGIDGFIVDWYGPASGLNLANEADRSLIDQATQALFAEANMTTSFKIALMYDYGALRDIHPLTRTTQMSMDMAYARSQYLTQSAYLIYKSKPLLFLFPSDTVTNVNLAQAKLGLGSTQVNLIYQNPREDPSISPYVNGYYAWVQPTTTSNWPLDGDDSGVPYLDWFYDTMNALTYTQKISVGAVWIGFNDTLAPWRTWPPRFIAQRDGLTWLETWTRTIAAHVPIVQIATWNDWEEGTAIEPAESNGTWVGTPIHEMNTLTNWSPLQGANAISVALAKRAGRDDAAVEMSYRLSPAVIQDNWVQMKLTEAHDIRSGDLIRFWFRGTPGVTNSLQVGLIDNGQPIYGLDLRRVTHVPAWVYTTLSYDLFTPWTTTLGYTQTSGQLDALFISAVRLTHTNLQTDVGGFGSVAIDGLQYLNSMSRNIPTSFESVNGNAMRANNAANWIAAQQNPTSGLVVSWPDEPQNKSWLYDQALALIVFSETDMTRAAKLAARLAALQNAEDGSWYEGYAPTTLTPGVTLTDRKWEGSVAWTVYALTRYIAAGGNSIYMTNAISGANWLKNQQAQFADGRVHTSTEATLDAWWAFSSTGLISEANKARDYLLNIAWRDDQKRWNRGFGDPVIVLDAQTWGASFAKAVGQPQRALAALSFAKYTLDTTSFSGLVRGLDGAGPFSVWNEGTAQYVATGGPDARIYLEELRRQQLSNGSMPGSPDNFDGGDVWLTTWSGIAPTAWYYFAETCGVFPSDNCRVYLPMLVKNH